MTETPEPQSLSKDGTRQDIRRVQRTRWRRVWFYTTFVWRFVVLRHLEPLIYGIALTDRCNLACRSCHVSNTSRRDMTWDELVAALHNAWVRGFRELYFSGGEPMLWRDADYTLADAIAEAKRIGFFHVHVLASSCIAAVTHAFSEYYCRIPLPQPRGGCVLPSGCERKTV